MRIKEKKNAFVIAVKVIHALRFELPILKKKVALQHEVQFGTSLKNFVSIKLKLSKV